MALPAAIGLGALAAVTVPWVLDGEPGVFDGLLGRGLAALPVGGHVLLWSWPVFGIVTALAWGLLAAARDR